MKQFFKSLAELQKRPELRKGMSLIEIMIVVTLMVAIMGLIGYNVIGQADKANDGLAETQLKSLKGGCEMYRVQYRKFPDSIEALVNTPDNRPIIEEVPEDPWGNPYNFEKNGNKIKIYSSGSDGLPNTDDDIVVNVG